MDFSALKHWRGRVRSILRIMAALLFMQHGTQKLLDFPLPGPDPLPPLLLAAGSIELFGGFLLAIGLFSRPVAFLLSGMAAAAYFIGHASSGFFPIINKGELAALYSFVFLYLFFAGPGPWSVDAVRRKGLFED
ncbi:DoxX family protein [Methylopila sp. M107]|uniref:DoxX family protein n=1 Tax=Methylopila sp. M107 TaxID=1101190 RepID=UPI00036A17A7|nr:DoxX family protein [Methylopila sp. M107]